MSTLKTINVIHPSGTINNIVNDASGNATIGNNLTVTGTSTVGGVAVVTSAPTATGNIPFSTNGTTWSSTAKIVQGTLITTTTTSFTGATSGASTTLTASSITGTIQIGQVIAGTNITAGTVITGGSGTSWTISPASTGTVSGTITVVGVEFQNIPSWVKRVTVLFNGYSTSGTSVALIRLGTSSGIVSTGYVSASGSVDAVPTAGLLSSTVGFVFAPASAGNSVRGAYSLTNISGNIWIGSFAGASDLSTASFGGGSISLSAVLDRVRITTVNGTDTFDAGSINILYE
jgi:hypothetical protein